MLYWLDADQLLDFTTKNNVADYTAAAALDPATPRLLRIAGDSISVRGMAAIAIARLHAAIDHKLGIGFPRHYPCPLPLKFNF